MKNAKSNKPWSLRLLRRSPFLYKSVQLGEQGIIGKIIARAGMRIIPVDWFAHPPDWMNRYLYFQRLARTVEKIPGDFVECGVASGHSFVCLCILAREDRINNRHVYGFDSFQGLPSPCEEDLSSSKNIAKKGLFSGANEERVLGNLRRAGLNEDFVKNRVSLVKGWFHETLPNYNGSIALLHVDADLYESCKITLEELWPKVAVGSIVAFDDYHQPEELPGEKKAVDEYFSRDPSCISIHHDPLCNRYFVIKIR